MRALTPWKLTEEGREILRTAEPLAKRVEDRILGSLSAKRRGEFMNVLASVVTTLQKPAAA